MTQPLDTVAVFECEDGLLLFGNDSALAAVDERLSAESKVIPKQRLARLAGQIGNATSPLTAHSGRWLKLTDESFKEMKTLGFGGSGVLRRDAGRIASTCSSKISPRVSSSPLPPRWCWAR